MGYSNVIELVGDVIELSGKPNVTVSTNVHELLECPVCLVPMYPPIHRCSNGQTICSECKLRVHNGRPTCRSELGNIRCLVLEKVGASLEFMSKFQNFGCLGMYPYYCKLKHESECQYRPYTDPYAGSVFVDLCDGILICSMTSVLDSCRECVEKMQHDLMFEVTALQEHQHKFATTKFIPCLCSQSGIFLS
ncbi:hypothetical protein ACQJBY_062515 [Aegilops geniculata]